MATKNWVLCGLLSLGFAMPTVALAPAPARASEGSAIEEVRDTQPIGIERRRRHNRKWRQAKQRARFAARRGNARDVVREFRRGISDPDVVVNVCVINVINRAENIVAIGGSVNQVINLIDSANCEFR